MAEEGIQRILQAIWGQRKGFVFLPHKDFQNNIWYEAEGIPYDGTAPSLEKLPKNDLYFCPLVFDKPARKKENAQPTNLLWADLDEANPENCRVRPSIAWESSPGRFQAIWFLTTEVSAEEASQLSKRQAYADGADKGGWDVTQVLRVPGTHNGKYESTPEVKLLWAKRNSWSPDEIRAAYPPVNGSASPTLETSPSNGLSWPTTISEATIQTSILTLPIGLRKRLSASSTVGVDRSKELQLLARDLLRHKIDSSVILVLLQRHIYNKFAGRSNEREMLIRQVEQAQISIHAPTVENTASTSKASTSLDAPSVDTTSLEGMRVHGWADFMAIPTRLRWLVDESWVDQTVGFVSGRSKSYKTWIALDLALSLVSGAAFLGRYPVRRTGPVILIQEEDPTAVLQDRLRLIAKSKGMLPTVSDNQEVLEITFPDYPLHIINLQGFNLGLVDRVNEVRRLIAEINPVMVILDPLVVMLPSGVDEFKATEIAAVLQSVKMWREEFGCSVLIVHHWNKGKTEVDERMAEHMYGSFAFHAWLESALHVMAVVDEDTEKIDTVLMEREFKAAPSGRSVKVHFNIDTKSSYTYEVELSDSSKLTAMDQSLLDLVLQAGAMTIPEIVATSGHARPKVSESINKLIRQGLLKGRKGGGAGKSTIVWPPDAPEPPK